MKCRIRMRDDAGVENGVFEELPERGSWFDATVRCGVSGCLVASGRRSHVSSSEENTQRAEDPSAWTFFVASSHRSHIPR